MGEHSLRRDDETLAVEKLCDRLVRGPAGLVIEGEAGVGKSTLMAHVASRATARGLRVLAARGAASEVTFAYAAVADLLADIDADLLTELPALHRMALDRVLVGSVDGPSTDERVVAAAVRSVIARVADESPVLVAVDDAHWLDPSSRAVLGYACRRLSGPVGVVAAIRTGNPDVPEGPDWMNLPRPEAIQRIRVRPQTLGGVHTLISNRLGRMLPRPAVARIFDVSGGNPLFALELARAYINDPSDALRLPDGLTALVRDRLTDLDDEATDVLLAAACGATPTVELLSAATARPTESVTASLEVAEARGIIRIEGNRVHFDHPLFATGVYTLAAPAHRRDMHRKLATCVQQQELRARHLALAATTADPATLEALDAAADATGAQGAPAAAAELTELAIKLGGDTVERRIRAAEGHFRSGNAPRAEAMLDEHTMGQLAGPIRSIAQIIRAGMRIHASDFEDAVDILEEARTDAAGIGTILVPILLFLSYCQLNSGHYAAALETADDCVQRAEAIGAAALISQALAAWVNARFYNGFGVDEAEMKRALALQVFDADVVIPLSADAINTMILAWSGKPDEAHAQMQAVRRRCIERGADTEMLWVEIHSASIGVWRGELAEATAAAEEAVQRAQQLGGDAVQSMAFTATSAPLAFAGRIVEARAALATAAEAGERCGVSEEVYRTIECKAFVEVSLGNYAEALTIMAPRLQRFTDMPSTELAVAAFVPYAVEALTALGRLDDAEPMIVALERNGIRLDRPWMLATGAFCRSLTLSAQGELAAAEQSALEALSHHARLQMRFELARTQLLLGQIQRRRGHRQAAATTLAATVTAFEHLGMPLWCARARDELARLDPAAGTSIGLTTTEQRVAMLAARGSSNKEIAAQLFISSKTVEANLSRVYRKLGLRSRVDLANRLAAAEFEGNP